VMLATGGRENSEQSLRIGTGASTLRSLRDQQGGDHLSDEETGCRTRGSGGFGNAIDAPPEPVDTELAKLVHQRGYPGAQTIHDIIPLNPLRTIEEDARPRNGFGFLCSSAAELHQWAGPGPFDGRRRMKPPDVACRSCARRNSGARRKPSGGRPHWELRPNIFSLIYLRTF